ncbi:MAG: MBL fold metallo-hydrolase [Spirochaetae bacterium HGW-Spirochaetae-1]|jgi:glyoxylase-like metal-dependent hydrolase (beta-lactamase superfamily II)|nr:MAG: MBL fold metallo-hydrolase [Spirochaetae bacterium HGW-Spirochaetae-1]
MEEIRFGNIVFLPGLNKGRYPYCNSLFIDDTIKAVIDPACSRDVLLNIKKTKGVDVIINTHYHEDHFAFNYLFPEAELWVNELDAPCFKSLESLYEFWDIYGTSLEPGFDEYLKSFNYQERVPAREFRDGDILDFGSTKLRVIHAPGHTPGHSCFYCEEQKLLFTADLDLLPFGPWYGDKYSDIDQTIASVHMLQKIPAEFFITSHHRGVMKGNIDREAEIYLNVIQERENRVLDFLKNESTIPVMREKWLIYEKPHEPLNFYTYAEEVMLKKHLAYSIKKGRLKKTGDRYITI